MTASADVQHTPRTGKDKVYLRAGTKDEADLIGMKSDLSSPVSKPSNGKRKREVSKQSPQIDGSQRKSKATSTKERFRREDKQGYSEYVYLLRDGTELRANDCIYLVCEPPGEPYYLGRIMEFTKLNSQSTEMDAVRVNWFYRPRDIQRQNADSRLVFATMHSDISPLHSIRSKCTVLHKSQISDIETYRKQVDSFYYERLFDKFMRRQYDVVPVASVTNVPNQVKEVLLQRWKYVIVEPNRSKELSMEHRSCRSCSRWCSSKDSVRCAICESDFHMHCVSPPLPRKPTRGFVWSCTPCSRAEAIRLSKINSTQLISIDLLEDSDEENLPKQEDPSSRSDVISTTDEDDPLDQGRKFSNRPELWPYRYLGVHCNVDDAVDYDDRIYPRAASRIGQRHQAAVQDWPGRPIQYFERAKRPIKRTAKAMKGRRTEERAAMESPMRNGHDSSTGNSASDITNTSWVDPATLSNNERPLWLQEKPSNYISRGEGATSDCQWCPSGEISDIQIEDYLSSAREHAERLSVDPSSPNFMDIALKSLYQADYKPMFALQLLAMLNADDIAEPIFGAEERLKFEASFKRNGSELSQVAQDVGTKTTAQCVRFYYIWKKTARGSNIRSKSEARKPKAEAMLTFDKSHQDPVNSEQFGDSSDDSAYSTVKAVRSKVSFQCKFCETAISKRWRRAPGVPDTRKNPIVALCQRCAILWRHYAVPWERPEEIYRKLHDGTYKGRRRKVEEELLKELPRNGAKPEKIRDESLENARPLKKLKKIESLKPDVVDPIPCAVCRGTSTIDRHTCRTCGLCVHDACYGLQSGEARAELDWICDTCQNSATPVASTDYCCVLCAYSVAHGDSNPQALKRTSDNNWVHVSCAIWNPYITFGSTNRLEPVEGIGAISLDHWQPTCEICNIAIGICLSCSACSKQVHVTCALQADYEIGFSLQSIKSSQSRRDGLALVRIGSENGLMTPVMYCQDHKGNDVGIHLSDELISDDKETALSLYARIYKAGSHEFADTQNGFGKTLPRHRKTSIFSRISDSRRRIKPDAMIFARESSVVGQDSIQCKCDTCGTLYSPFFYMRSNADEVAPQYLCHRCHWQASVHESAMPAKGNAIDKLLGPMTNGASIMDQCLN